MIATQAATRLVDVHAHFVTSEYVAAARAAGHEHPDGMPSWPSWSADEHLRLMDAWGVSRSVLSVSSPGTHFGDDAAARTLSRHVNEFGAAVAHARPDRFGHFASLPLPDVAGAAREAAHALDELGSDGVTMQTNARGVYPGDPRLEPLYAELSRRHAVVFVHPTSPPCAEQVALGRPRPMIEFLFDSARAVTDLLLSGTLARYPDIQWVFTHAGGVLPLLTDRIELFRSVFPGTGGSGPTVRQQVARLWFDIAGTPFPSQVPILVDAVGPERLLYGSDFCWTPPAAVARQITSIDTAPPPASRDGADWRALTARNAARLFDRAR